MGTRSVVFVRTERGLKGVYVHFDGYPESRLPILHQLIQRDGPMKVVMTLAGKSNGWSHLNVNQKADLEPHYSDGRFIAVPGYGVQYSELPVMMSGKNYIQADTEYKTPENIFGDCFIEYVYVIEQDGTVTWAEHDYTVPFNKLKWRVSHYENCVIW